MGLTKIRAGQILNLDYKQSCKVLTDSNIVLSGGAPRVVDGVIVYDVDRVLVIGQTNPAENGIYRVLTPGTGSNGTWIRSRDANEDDEVEAGMIVMVTEGDVYKDTQWKLTSNDPIILGTTPLIFEQNSAFAFGNIYANGTAVLANVVGDTLTLSPSNNIAITGNAASKAVTVGVTASGNTTEVQYNLSGNLAGNAGLTYAPGLFNVLGNSQANFFVGDGRYLTNIVATGGSSITNGNSEIKIQDPNGAANVTIGNVINVAVFTEDGVTITGNATASGNIAGNYFLGNGAFLTGITTTAFRNLYVDSLYTGASNVAPIFSDVIGNIFFERGSGVDFTTDPGNFRITFEATPTQIDYDLVTDSVTQSNTWGLITANTTSELDYGLMGIRDGLFVSTGGIIAAANITTDGNIVAAGNIIGNNIITTGALEVAELTAATINTNSIRADDSSLVSIEGLTVDGDATVDGDLDVAGNLLVTGDFIGVTVNAATFLASTAFTTTGNVSANLVAANVLTANSITAGNAALSGTVSAATIVSSGAANAATVNAGNVYSNLLYATGNVVGANLVTTGQVDATGNVVGANLVTTGQVDATGNITGNYFIGDGSQLTNLPAGNYSNANVAAYLPTYTGNLAALTGVVTTTANVNAANVVASANIVASGNVAATYFIGNGSQLTGITSGSGGNVTVSSSPPVSPNTGDIWIDSDTAIQYLYFDDGDSSQWAEMESYLTVSTASDYGNTEVAAYLPTYTGNLASLAGNVTTSADVNANNVVLTGVLSVNTIRSDDSTVLVIEDGVSATSLDVQGEFSTQSVSSDLIPSANVTFDLGSSTNRWNDLWLSNSTIYLGNATISANASAITFTNPEGGVTTLAGETTDLSAETITATGNITGNYFIGNGSQLTGIPESYGNANVAAYLPTYTGNLAGGNLTIGNITVSADTIVSDNSTLTIDPSTTGSGGLVIIAGNLQVTGTTTTVDSTTVTINDLAINVANNASIASEANGGGLKVGPVGSEYAALTYASTGDKWVSDRDFEVTGNATANYFLGNGSQLAGAKTTVSGSAPGSASQGDIWIDTDTGKQFIYFNDGDSAQWVEMEAALSFVSTGGGGGANSFSTIDANGTSLVATSSTETLTLAVGNNLTITGNASSDTATFAVSDAPTFTGNVTGGNLVTAGQANVATVVASGNITATGNVAGGNITTAGQTIATGNVTGGNLVTAGVVDATGNVIGGNLVTAGIVDATGNVIGGNLNTAGIVDATGNVIGGNIITAGNVSGLNFLGNIAVANVVGTATAAQGGTGRSTLTSNNVLIGNGTGAVNFVAPGTSGNVLTSNGSAWLSQAAAGGTASGIVQAKHFIKTSSFSTTSSSLTEVTGYNATPQITIPAGRSTSIVKVTVTTCVYLDDNGQGSFPSGYFQIREGGTNIGDIYYVIIDVTNGVYLAPITIVAFSSAGSGTRGFNFQAATGIAGQYLELPYTGYTYIMLEEITP